MDVLRDDLKMTDNLKIGLMCTSKKDAGNDIYLITQITEKYIETMLIISKDYKDLLFTTYHPSINNFDRLYKILK